MPLLFIGVTSFADADLSKSDTELVRSCIVSVTSSSYDEFCNCYTTDTEYHYLGEVDNNGFGNLDCLSRARRFMNLNY